MRITNSLLLGATALIWASAPLLAQNTRAPAVPPLPAKQAQAAPAAKPAPLPVRAEKQDSAPPTTAEIAAPTTDNLAAPTADDRAPVAELAPPALAPVAAATASVIQEANATPAAAEPEGNLDDSNSIVATVNDESISDYEVRQRVALYVATSGINQQLPPEQRKRIRAQILESLEAEKIQLQEAVKKKSPSAPPRWTSASTR